MLAFLHERIRSFEDLETLLLLRNDPSTLWSADLVASRLKIPAEAAQEALDRLCKHNLLGVRLSGESTAFTYNPGTSTLRESIDGLVRANEDNRIEVIKAMSRSAIDRVRTSAIQTFADAFFFLLFVDLVLVPTVDLTVLRGTIALVAMMILLFGLIWESK